MSILTKSQIANLNRKIATLKRRRSPGFNDSPMQIIVKTLTGKECHFWVLRSDWVAELKLELSSSTPFGQQRNVSCNN